GQTGRAPDSSKATLNKGFTCWEPTALRPAASSTGVCGTGAPRRRGRARRRSSLFGDGAQFLPGVLDLGGIVLARFHLDVEAEIDRVQPARRRQQRELGDGLLRARRDQLLTRRHQFRLGIEDVQRRTLPDVALLNGAL